MDFDIDTHSWILRRLHCGVLCTVNVNIFACLHFRGIMKMGNFACIKIRDLIITGSLGYQTSKFPGGHIFADILRNAN